MANNATKPGDLLRAAKAGDADGVCQCLARGSAVDEGDEDGWTALFWVAERGDVGLLRLLHNSGATVNKKDQWGWTALFYAARNGHDGAARALVELGAFVNAKGNDGKTALYCAAMNGHVDAVQVLVDLGAIVNENDSNGMTALFCAACNGHSDAVRVLVELGAIVNKKDSNGTTPLFCAAENGHSGVVQMLVELGAFVNEKDKNGMTALFYAACNGHSDVVRVLVELGAIVNENDSNGTTALFCAAENGHSDAVRVLVGLGAIVNAEKNDGATALFCAAENGHSDTVRVLVGLGALVNENDSNGTTPLFCAAENGHSDAVRVLVELGAFVDEKDKNGMTALFYAACNGHSDAVRALVGLGAIVNENDSNGTTALFCAAMNGHSDAVRVLVELGAIVNKKDSNGTTPLFCAAENGHVDANLALVELGAFVNEKDKNGNTALDFAARNGHTRVVEVLNQLRPSTHQPSPDNESSLQDNGQSGHSRSTERAEPADGTTAVQSADTKPEVTTVDVPVKALSESSDHALNQFLVVKLSRVLPNVLPTLQYHCSSVFEAEEMSKRVFGRLQGIFEQLHDVDVTEKRAALDEYSDVIARFDQFLLKHGKHDFVTRLVLCLQVADDILRFHEEIDQVELALELPRTSIVSETRVNDREKQLKSFGNTCANVGAIAQLFKNDRMRLDALTLLRNMLSHRRESRDEDVNYHWQIIESLHGQLTRSSPEPSDVIVADWFVPPYQVECDEKPFSEGSFGAVYHGKMNGAVVVVKCMLSVGDDGARQQFLKEVQVWSRLRHPHVLLFLGACHIGQLFFVCDYAKNGTLPAFLKKGNNQQFTWEKLHEVALGLQYLHDRHIIHGDLKGNNLLVATDGRAKVADFGLSLIVASSKTLKPVELGAPRWRAPEVLKGESISMPSDIYAFGMCIVEAVSGENPWGNALPDAAVRRNVKKGVPLLRPSGFSDVQWELVTRMIAFEPSERVKIAAVVGKLDTFRIEELSLTF
ncbi:Tkl protein kinase, partial [Globisporangium splendens]